MIITIKNAILFFILLFVAGVTGVYSHPAWGIVVDRQRQIYFSDLVTVWKIDAQGKLSVFRTGVGGRHVHDLSIDTQDNVYGLDNSYVPETEKHLRSIWKMSPAGKYNEIAALTEILPSGMSIWQDPGGNMFAVEPWNNERRESRIMKRTVDGKTSLFAGGNYGYLDGKKENAKFGNVLDMAFAKDGSIYLTDSNRVRKIDKFGIVETLFPDKISMQKRKSKRAENPSQLFGLAVDRQDNVFVADFANRKLLKINSDGEISTALNSETDWSPLGAATFEDDVYVLEGRPVSSSNKVGNRVLKISADGKSTVVANTENGKESSESPNRAANTTPETNDSIHSSKSDFVKNPLPFYGVIGIASIVFVAFFIFARKKI